MKLTQTRKVGEIVRPLTEGLPPAPCVGLADPIMRAVELMVKNGLTHIAVVGCQGVIGHIRLEDALRHLGLRLPVPMDSSDLSAGGGRLDYLKNER